MPFALLIIGIVFIIVAVRNTQDAFVTVVQGEFSGPGNFWWWIAAVIMIGMVGYVPKLKGLSDALLILILLTLVLATGNPEKMPGGGVFKQFVEALKGTAARTGGSAPGAPGASVSGTIGVGPVRIGVGR